MADDIIRSRRRPGKVAVQAAPCETYACILCVCGRACGCCIRRRTDLVRESGGRPRACVCVHCIGSVSIASAAFYTNLVRESAGWPRVLRRCAWHASSRWYVICKCEHRLSHPMHTASHRAMCHEKRFEPFVASKAEFQKICGGIRRQRAILTAGNVQRLKMMLLGMMQRGMDLVEVFDEPNAESNHVGPVTSAASHLPQPAPQLDSHRSAHLSMHGVKREHCSSHILKEEDLSDNANIAALLPR